MTQFTNQFKNTKSLLKPLNLFYPKIAKLRENINITNLRRQYLFQSSHLR